MRRGFALAMAVAALGGVTSSLHAQYPYAPMPYGPMPAYGYPPAQRQPMPMYGPAPMPYYPPGMQRAPMPLPTTSAPRVYDFGALPEETITPVVTTTGPSMPLKSTNTTPASTPIFRPTSGGARTLPTLFKHHAKQETEGCGPQGCGPQGCPPTGCNDGCGTPCDACAPPPARPQPRPYPCGHFFGDAGMFFLMSGPSNRNAYTQTAGGVTNTTDFPRDVVYAPRFTLGYVFHNGWGARADYWFTHGSIGTSVVTSTVANVIATPTPAPFKITSPSATLKAGLGADQFTFTQAIQMGVGGVEVIHEGYLFGTTFMTGFGARHAQINQSYSATRINAGGIGIDREDLNIASRFEGLGPTLSIDGVCPIFRQCLSLYSNVRGSALFGVDRFNQDYSLQRATTLGGVPSNARVFNTSSVADNRTVYAVEVEAGLQLGRRIGGCYWFSRAGIAAQRWWDVGSPVSSTGDLSFLGGTFQVGLTY